MPFSHAAPPSPTPSASSGSTGPRTPESSTALYARHLSLPVLPDLEGCASNLDVSDDSSPGGVKRTLKMKQRISTAERRASHNAVERMRRDALNARFLDLAAVLPNLASVRRPSKSSIVNSSIAYIHASHRQRVFAAQQLRALATECESLRREVNEWRARGGVMRLDTPSRGDLFSMVLGEELHYEVGDFQGACEEDADDYAVSAMPGYRAEDETMRLQMLQAQQQAQSPFAHNVPAIPPHPHSAPLPRSSSGSPHGHSVTDAYAFAVPAMHPQPHAQSPMIASPTSYDNYDQQLQLQQMMMQQETDEKWAYAQQMMHAQGALETPQILAQARSRQELGVW